MADFKPPAKRDLPMPTVVGNLGRVADLPRTADWLGFAARKLARNTKLIHASADEHDGLCRQGDSYTALIGARMRIARKLAELADLPHVIAEDQRIREHNRWQAEIVRTTERRDAEHQGQLAAIRRSAELARVQESAVRAQRNLEAALRVKDAQLDQWYAEQQARSNNAKAEWQDTQADLARGIGNGTASPPSDASAAQKAEHLALIDRLIELERGRGNDAAVLALLNLKALLSGA